MKHLQWKYTLFFWIITTTLCFFYQLYFLADPGDIISFVENTSPTTLLLLLLQAGVFAVLLSIPVFLYLRRSGMRLQKLLNAVYDWRRDDFFVTIEDNGKDDIGQLGRSLNEMAEEIQEGMNIQKERSSVNERNNLARELHDTVKQQIFALAFQISIAKKIHHSKNDQLSMHLQEAKNILQDIQEELANLIAPMRQGTFENQDLADALVACLSRWSHQYGIFVKFTTEIQGREKNYFFSSHVKGTFFRVAQEALSNVGRHSKASCVTVTLTIDWMYITLKIADNGQGFNTAQPKEGGVGLSSMKERMKSIDGDLLINSELFSGTEIVALYRPKGTGPDVATLTTMKKDKPY